MSKLCRFKHVLVVGGLLFPSLFAAADDAASFAPRVEQWGIQELALRSQRTYANPFADVSIQARFRSQGKETTVDGFCDGHQTWKIRFMPETSGTWTFTTISVDPDLNEKSGSFVADRPGSGNHGPVILPHSQSIRGYEPHLSGLERRRIRVGALCTARKS